MRARRLPALGVGLLLALPACASVPDSGPVRRVGTTSSSSAVEDSVIEQPEVLLLPPEPVPGLSPEEVLRGFLAASAASDRDHGLAREYLTGEASAEWDDDAGVVVHDPGQVRIECRSDDDEDRDCAEPDGLVLTGRQQASISEDGAWSVESGTFSDVIGVERVDGEWRLSSVPDGVRLTPADVARTYRPVEVSFLGPAREQLVADRVFLPVVSRPLPQLLVETLLRGPTSRLAGAVRTAVPDGTRLRGLRLEGGVVQVDLTAPAAAADGPARQALSAQLVSTLRQVPDVTGLRLLVEGEPFDVPEGESPQPMDGWPQFDPRGERVHGPGLVVAADGVRPLLAGGEAGLGAVIGPVLVEPAIDLELTRLAGLRPVREGRQELVTGRRASPTALSVRATAPGFAPPSWGGGRYGVWTARRDRPGELLLVPDRGDALAVPLPPRASGTVRQVRVSRDDVRVAVVVGEEGDARLLVGVLRPDPARPGRVALERLEEVAPALSDVRDVDWSDGLALTVLARSGGAPAAWTVQSDGSVVAPLPASGLSAAPTALASAPDAPLLVQSGSEVWEVVDGVARRPVPGTDPFYAG